MAAGKAMVGFLPRNQRSDQVRLPIASSFCSPAKVKRQCVFSFARSKRPPPVSNGPKSGILVSGLILEATAMKNEFHNPSKTRKSDVFW
jgi:hypothetical protein